MIKIIKKKKKRKEDCLQQQIRSFPLLPISIFFLFLQENKGNSERWLFGGETLAWILLGAGYLNKRIWKKKKGKKAIHTFKETMKET